MGQLDLATDEGEFRPGLSNSTIDLRGDYDEIAYLKDGILYRKGNVIQVWWDKWEKETWSGLNEQQANEKFNIIKLRWPSSELGNPEPGNPKEAWQMTREKFNNYIMTMPRSYREALIGGEGRELVLEASRTGKSTHQLLVEQAISEGKLVPAEVLADYPDLAPGNPKGIIKLVIVKFPETGEYKVRWLEDGQISEKKSYYTDDYDDAIATARTMASNARTLGHEVTVEIHILGNPEPKES